MILRLDITRLSGASIVTAGFMVVGLASPGWADQTSSEGSPETSAGIGDEGFHAEAEDQWSDSLGDDGGTDFWNPGSNSGGSDGAPSGGEESAEPEVIYDLQSTCFDEETFEYNVLCSNLYYLNQPCENQGDYEDIEDATIRCVPDWNVGGDSADSEGADEPSPAAVAESAFLSMSPDPASVEFEPDLLGFGYAGRHTNMYADAEAPSTSEELLGETMEIRASPVSYHWDYGDGTSRTTSEPGGPLPDYDGAGNPINRMDFATETSHVYEETGIYPVTVTVVYVGEFRYGDGEWTSISGRLRVESSPGEADIWTQNSRWVSGACESQQQWGCNGPVQFDPATDRPPKIYQDQYDEDGRWIGPVN